jgi:hypothetical protein
MTDTSDATKPVSRSAWPLCAAAHPSLFKVNVFDDSPYWNVPIPETGELELSPLCQETGEDLEKARIILAFDRFYIDIRVP